MAYFKDLNENYYESKLSQEPTPSFSLLPTTLTPSLKEYMRKLKNMSSALLLRNGEKRCRKVQLISLSLAFVELTATTQGQPYPNKPNRRHQATVVTVTLPLTPPLLPLLSLYSPSLSPPSTPRSLYMY